MQSFEGVGGGECENSLSNFILCAFKVTKKKKFNKIHDAHATRNKSFL